MRTFGFITLSLALVVVAVSLVGCELRLEFVRGLWWSEPWRVVTCQWTHFGGSHLAWNLAVFVVVGLSCERLDRGRTVVTLALASVLIPLAVYLGCPRLETFRGLSGIDTALVGLVAAILTQCAIAGRDRGMLLLCLFGWLAVISKTVFELSTASAVFVGSGAGFVVVPVAHLAGFAVGTFVGVMPVADLRGWLRRKRWRLMMPAHGRFKLR